MVLSGSVPAARAARAGVRGRRPRCGCARPALRRCDAGACGRCSPTRTARTAISGAFRLLGRYLTTRSSASLSSSSTSAGSSELRCGSGEQVEDRREQGGVRGAVPGMAFQQLPDGSEHERQDDPVPLRELERALDRRLRAGPVAEPVPSGSVEQQRMDGRPAPVERLRRAARSSGPAGPARLAGLPSRQLERRRGEPHARRAAFLGDRPRASAARVAGQSPIRACVSTIQPRTSTGRAWPCTSRACILSAARNSASASSGRPRPSHRNPRA